MIRKAKKLARFVARPAAWKAVLRDAAGIPVPDPGIDATLEAAFEWLARAQDHSASADGGVARHYSLLSGWGSSYPETTGYILNTWCEQAARTGLQEPQERICRAVEWLCSIQLPEGGFPGGVITANRAVPVVFNTGQIVLGLAAAARYCPEATQALTRASDWLVALQSNDGAWHRGNRPNSPAGARTYETHVAWGLLEAAKSTGNDAYAEAARKNIDWAVRLQSSSGWFERCSLWEPERTLTHTIGYALRGVLEAWQHGKDAPFLAAARRTADALLDAQREDGALPGCFDANWKPTASWICLTGVSQVALCWLRLYEATDERRYLEAARAANRLVRRTISLGSNRNARGGVAGSFPVWGAYCPFEYPNWAVKFTIDAQLLERKLALRESPLPSGSPSLPPKRSAP